MTLPPAPLMDCVVSCCNSMAEGVIGVMKNQLSPPCLTSGAPVAWARHQVSSVQCTVLALQYSHR